MLSKKYSGRVRFLKDTVALSEALSKTKIEGTILTASGSWYRTDKVTTAEFEFLVVDDKFKPFQINVNFDGKTWKCQEKDVEEGLGKMEDEVKFAKKLKLVPEEKAFEAIKDDKRLKKAMRKGPHMLIISWNYSIYDDEYKKPTWRAVIKNWPLINYLKVDEESRTVEAVVDAVKGKLLGLKEYQ